MAHSPIPTWPGYEATHSIKTYSSFVPRRTPDTNMQDHPPRLGTRLDTQYTRPVAFATCCTNRNRWAQGLGTELVVYCARIKTGFNIVHRQYLEGQSFWPSRSYGGKDFCDTACMQCHLISTFAAAVSVFISLINTGYTVPTTLALFPGSSCWQGRPWEPTHPHTHTSASSRSLASSSQDLGRGSKGVLGRTLRVTKLPQNKHWQWKQPRNEIGPRIGHKQRCVGKR